MKTKTLLVIVAVFYSFFQFTGCTVIGLVAGGIADGNRTFSTNDKIDLKDGIRVAIACQNADTLRGIYGGAVTISPEAYREMFDAARNKLPEPKLLPSIGDSIIIDTHQHHREFRGTFVGFDPNAIKLCTSNDGDIGNPEIPISNLLKFEAQNGQSFSPSVVGDLVMRGLIPSISAVAIKHDTSMILVPNNTVKSIMEIGRNTHYWFTYGLTGLATDALVFLVITYFDNQPPLFHDPFNRIK